MILAILLSIAAILYETFGNSSNKSKVIMTIAMELFGLLFLSVVNW